MSQIANTWSGVTIFKKWNEPSKYILAAMFIIELRIFLFAVGWPRSTRCSINAGHKGRLSHRRPWSTSCIRHVVRIAQILLLRICYASPAASADGLLLVNRVQRFGRQQTGERATRCANERGQTNVSYSCTRTQVLQVTAVHSFRMHSTQAIISD